MADKVLKAGIYARTSTPDQKIDMQLEDLRRFCRLKGFEIYKEYIDEGISGSQKHRPGLDQLMDDAFKYKINVVVVWKFDRFARSTIHLLETLDEFKARGIQFISYREDFDTSTPIGMAMFTVIGAMAQFERDIMRERIKAGVKRAREKGVKFGRKCFYVDPKDVEYLRNIEKMSIRQIAARVGSSAGRIHRMISEIKKKNDKKTVEE